MPPDASSPPLPIELHPVMATLAGPPEGRLFRSAAELEAALGGPVAIDWDRAWVLWYAVAEPGARVAITEASAQDGHLQVSVRVTTPATGCAASPPLAAPGALVMLEKTLLPPDLEATFVRQDEVAPCARLERQARQLTELTSLHDQLAARSAVVADHPVDRAATLALASRLVLDGEGDDAPFLTAARSVLLAFPAGHLYLSGPMPYEQASDWGVCARPSGDAAVVTHARAPNRLGLRPGDAIVAVNNETSSWMLDTSWRRALSGIGTASPSQRRTMGAVALFSALRPGSVLRVRGPDGTVRTVRASLTSPGEHLDCTDPLGRDDDFDVKTTIRPDGIAVIRLPVLTARHPVDPAQAPAEMRAAVQAAFDEAKSAPGIVWDLRANAGGSTTLAYEIVGGMPGARSMVVHSVTSRIPMSEPAAFYPPSPVSVTAGGSFAYGGKVAVLVDGLTISAADYFALAVRAATDVPLVGTPGAGAFGSMLYGDLHVSSDPQLDAVADVFRGLDAAGAPLEGRAAEPTVFVELDPADLARGVDTQLEAAVALVR